MFLNFNGITVLLADLECFAQGSYDYFIVQVGILHFTAVYLLVHCIHMSQLTDLLMDIYCCQFFYDTFYCG